MRGEGSAALPPPLFAGLPLPDIRDAASTKSEPWRHGSHKNQRPAAVVGGSYFVAGAPADVFVGVLVLLQYWRNVRKPCGPRLQSDSPVQSVAALLLLPGGGDGYLLIAFRHSVVGILPLFHAFASWRRRPSA